MSAESVKLQELADQPPNFWRKQGPVPRTLSSVPELRSSSSGKLAKHSSWTQSNLQHLPSQGDIDPVRIKLASVALAGAGANSIGPGEQIKAAWPGTARHGHHQLAQPASPTSSFAPRGPPKPYKTFSNASQDLSRGDALPGWAPRDTRATTSASSHHNRKHSTPVKQPSLPGPPMALQRGTSRTVVKAAEPSLISWDEVEAPEDVYQAVTLADGRPALIKGRSGVQGPGELLVLMDDTSRAAQGPRQMVPISLAPSHSPSAAPSLARPSTDVLQQPAISHQTSFPAAPGSVPLSFPQASQAFSTGLQEQLVHCQMQPQGSQPQLFWAQPQHSWEPAAQQQQQQHLSMQSFASTALPQPMQMHSSQQPIRQLSGISYLQHQASLLQQQWAASAPGTSLPMPQAYMQPQLYLYQKSPQPPALAPGMPQLFPQQSAQQQSQAQLPHTQSLPMGLPTPGLWPQQPIASQQPDSPIVNTQGNPFAPPRAYLIDEEAELQQEPSPIAPKVYHAEPDASSGQAASSCNKQSTPKNDSFAMQSFKPHLNGLDQSDQLPDAAAFPASPPTAAQPSWHQFPTSPASDSKQSAVASSGSGSIPGWHTFDATEGESGYPQLQQQQGLPAATDPFTAQQLPQSLHPLGPDQGSRVSSISAATSPSPHTVSENHDPASSILGSLYQGQGLKPVRQLSDQSPEALRSHQALLPGNTGGAMATAVSIGGAQLPQVINPRALLPVASVSGDEPSKKPETRLTDRQLGFTEGHGRRTSSFGSLRISGSNVSYA